MHSGQGRGAGFKTVLLALCSRCAHSFLHVSGCVSLRRREAARFSAGVLGCDGSRESQRRAAPGAPSGTYRTPLPKRDTIAHFGSERVPTLCPFCWCAIQQCIQPPVELATAGPGDPRVIWPTAQWTLASLSELHVSGAAWAARCPSLPPVSPPCLLVACGHRWSSSRLSPPLARPRLPQQRSQVRVQGGRGAEETRTWALTCGECRVVSSCTGVAWRVSGAYTATLAAARLRLQHQRGAPPQDGRAVLVRMAPRHVAGGGTCGGLPLALARVQRRA